MDHKQWYIYALLDPRDRGVRYVGWSFDPAMRLYKHISEAVRNKSRTHKVCWLKSLNAAGLRPLCEVLESGTQPLGQYQAEKRWIAHFRQQGCRLTNSTDGGEGVPNLPPDVKERMRMAQSTAAKRRWSSVEERRRQSERRAGSKASLESRRKRSISLRKAFSDPAIRQRRSEIGKLQSVETRRKIGEAGRRAWAAKRRALYEEKHRDQLWLI